MNISTKTRYSLRALVELETLFDKKQIPIHLNDISRNQKISLRYLENIFHTLTKHNILKGVKGKSGGFIFSRPPDKIYVDEIISILDKPLAKIICLSDKEKCNLYEQCHTTSLWRELQVCLNSFLSKISIHDLKEKTMKHKNYI